MPAHRPLPQRQRSRSAYTMMMSADPPMVDDDGERSPSISRTRIEADLDELVEAAGTLVSGGLDYDTALHAHATRMLPAVGGDPARLWSIDNVLATALA